MHNGLNPFISLCLLTFAFAIAPFPDQYEMLQHKYV